MSEVFLDTETTGLSFKDGHKVVEIEGLRKAYDQLEVFKTFFF